MSPFEPRLTPRAAIDRLTSRCADARLPDLWVAGCLDGLAAPAVAVVGTRAATSIGLRRAAELAAGLARRGVTVISGLALGIDAAAHRGALAEGAPTIGVLGSGHDVMYPRANRPLAAEMIAGGGAVLSPYAPGTPAFPHRFLARNAIVAALADVVVVVKAAERSGAINTAGWAAEFNRPVLAFPGEVERPKAAGCHALIRDGATLARGVGDVIAALPVALPMPAEPLWPQRAARDVLPAFDRALLDALEHEPQTIDALVDRLNEPAGTVLATLTSLELAGYLARVSADRYVRSHPPSIP